MGTYKQSWFVDWILAVKKHPPKLKLRGEVGILVIAKFYCAEGGRLKTRLYTILIALSVDPAVKIGSWCKLGKVQRGKEQATLPCHAMILMMAPLGKGAPNSRF